MKNYTTPDFDVTVPDGANYTATINFAYPVSNKEDGITKYPKIPQITNPLRSKSI